MQRLLKPKEFGRLFGFTERTVRAWMNAGRVEVIKIGAGVRIPASEADRLIREGRRPAASAPRVTSNLSDAAER
jgi:predicted site-specific integrase-resolvase